MVFGLEVIVGILFCSLVVFFPRASNPLMILLLLSAISLAISTAILSIFYPWSNLIVSLTAYSGGILIARTLRTIKAFTVFLLVLSSLDIAQAYFTSGPPPQGMNSYALYGNIFIANPINFKLGIIDVLIICAMAEHWKERKRGLLPFLPAFLGLITADFFSLISGIEGLPLIPFLALGFFLTSWINSHIKKPINGKEDQGNRFT